MIYRIAITSTRLIVCVPQDIGRVKIELLQSDEQSTSIQLVSDPSGSRGSRIKDGWKYEISNAQAHVKKRGPRFGLTSASASLSGNGNTVITASAPYKNLMLRGSAKGSARPIPAPVVSAPPIGNGNGLASLRECVARINQIKQELGRDLELSIRNDGRISAIVQY